MKTVQEQALPDTIVIERVTLTADGAGGNTESWAAIGTVTGRLMPITRTAGEPVTGGQPASISHWWATLPVGTDVTESDRLVTGDRSFEVVRVNLTQSWQTAVRCECVALNRERRT